MISACATPTAPVTQAPAPAVAAAPVEVEAPAPEPVAPALAAPEPIAVDMARIENQTPTEVIGYLGTPSLVRRDDTVQVMIFETNTCVVEVIFLNPLAVTTFGLTGSTPARPPGKMWTPKIACAASWSAANNSARSAVPDKLLLDHAAARD